MPRVLKFDLIAKRLSDQPAFPEDSTLFWSSRPYALDVVDEIEAGMALVGGDLRTGIYAIPDESLDAVMALESGSLRALLQTYDWPAEQIDAAMALESGELRVLLKSYTDWPAEGIDAGMGIGNGTLVNGLVSYVNWPAEGIDATMASTSGTLT